MLLRRVHPHTVLEALGSSGSSQELPCTDCFQENGFVNCLGQSGEQGTKVASWLLEITGPVKVRESSNILLFCVWKSTSGDGGGGVR